MATISPIRVRFTAVGKKIAPLATTALTAELKAYAKDFAEAVRDEVREYPPPVPIYGVRYERGGADRGQASLIETGSWPRTNTLYNAWRIYETHPGGGIAYQITNDAHEPGGLHRPYAAWVHGSPTTRGPAQTWFHEDHGWKRIDEALADIGTRREYTEDINRIISKHLNISPR